MKTNGHHQAVRTCRRRLVHLALFVISSLALGSGCFRSARADFDLSGIEGTPLFESERNWAATMVDDRYRILNNVWNQGASTGQYRQKVFVKESKGKLIFGWVWEWPASSGPVSYPEVQVGQSPWGGEVGANSGFPFRAGAKKLVVDYDLSLNASGSYNTAFDVWMVSSLPVTLGGMTHLVMVVLTDQGLGAVGDLIGDAAIAGHQFHVYLERNHRDASGTVPNTWSVIYLLPDKPILHGPLDLGAIVSHLVEKRLLDSNLYVACLDLGNNVVSGSGKTEIRNYAVRVE